MSTISFDNRNRTWALLGALVILVAFAAAFGLMGTGLLAVTPAGTGAPESPQALWEAQAPANYRYTLQVGCFCITDMTRPVIIEVRDGAVASITYADDGSAANPALFEQYDSIDDLFATIAAAEAQEPVRLDVTYAEETGIPLSIDIDISEQMADEELYLTVSNFEALR